MLTGGRVPSAVAQDPGVHPVVGLWLVTTSFGGTRGLTLSSLVTYTEEGNVLVANAGQTPNLPPNAGLTLTESHGAWQATGERSAAAIFVLLTLDLDGTTYPINTVGTALEVDDSGNDYVGVAEQDSTDPEGNVINSTPATFEATRIVVEPPAAAATPAA